MGDFSASAWHNSERGQGGLTDTVDLGDGYFMVIERGDHSGYVAKTKNGTTYGLGFYEGNYEDVLEVLKCNLGESEENG